MFFRLRLLILFLLFLSITSPALAQSESGESGGNTQSPVQVIVQVVVTAAILKILDKFDLP